MVLLKYRNRENKRVHSNSKHCFEYTVLYRTVLSVLYCTVLYCIYAYSHTEQCGLSGLFAADPDLGQAVKLSQIRILLYIGVKFVQSYLPLSESTYQIL